jgi:anti-sigma-K factor RskA
MAYDEDQIALAAEYALGTLDGDERAQVASMMAADRDYAALVQAWEFRLSVLNQMVGLVEPRPEVWDRIKAAIASSAPQVAAVAEVPAAELPPSQPQLAHPEPPELLQAEQAPAAPLPPEPLPAQEVAPVVDAMAHVIEPGPRDTPPAADNSSVIQLTSRVRQWRTVANAMTALAAVLLATLAVQVYRPDLLPEPLRPKPRSQLADVTAPPPAQYVALLQKDGTSPAFILTVDAGSKTFIVRRVGATPEPGKSFELWLVSDKLPQPRSLGVIGGSDFTTRPTLSSFDSETVSHATYAVSVEPEGGSPTGAVTGPIVFSGKLVETVPAAAGAPPR